MRNVLSILSDFVQNQTKTGPFSLSTLFEEQRDKQLTQPNGTEGLPCEFGTGAMRFKSVFIFMA